MEVVHPWEKPLSNFAVLHFPAHKDEEFWEAESESEYADDHSHPMNSYQLD